MNDQNQNVQPNYDFITNQQAPIQKKGPNPFVLFGGVIGVFGLIVGLIFVMSNNNVKTASGPKFDVASQVPEQYFRHMADGTYENAFKLFSSETQNLVTQEKYVAQVPSVFANVDVSQCVADAANSEQIVNYTCPTKQGGTMLKFVFNIVKQEDTYRINRYDIELEQPNDKKS